MAVEICRITPEELKRRLDQRGNVVVVDVRQPGSYLADPYEIPGAVRIPPDELAQHYRSLPRDAQIVTFCT